MMWLTILFSAYIVSVSVQAQNVSIPVLAPSSARPLSSNLLAFSLEQDRWPDWAGVDSKNQFTHNALANYGKLTGVPPKIRVGANSEDHTVWSPTVTINSDTFPPPNSVTPYPEATKIIVGDGYYALSRFMLAGTHMTWGINLGLDNAANAKNKANSILKAFTSAVVKQAGVVLDFLEIGDEADLYKNNGLRPSNWTVEEYVADWINISTPVAQAIHSHPLDAGPVAIQGAAFAGQGFTPTEIFSLGILNSAPGKLITTISQHRYSAAFCNGGDFPLVSFMSKANVRSNLTVFRDDIEATAARGLNYILGETGSIACHGAPGVSNTAGAALWVVDYTLQAATLGINEVYFHEGIGFKYNFFQPIALNRSITDGSAIDPSTPPHVQPSYYAGLLINTFIGSSGEATISELTVDDDNVSGYAVYEGDTLQRAVFVNLGAWLASSQGTRPSVHIDLDLVLDGTLAKVTPPQSMTPGRESAITAAQSRRLVIAFADDTSGLTWAGQDYETSDVQPTGETISEAISLEDGFDLRATEAILITFD